MFASFKSYIMSLPVKTKLRNILIFTFMALIPTVLVWLPFMLKLKSFWGIPLPGVGMSSIVANYDGPLFLVVSKTLYNFDLIRFNYSFPLPLEYYAAHFPLFPLLIRVFAFALGYPYSMLFVTIVSSILALYFFHKFISDYVDSKNAFWLTFVFSIFPARWLIVRSVGSAEPLFVASIIASLYYFQKEKYWLAGIWGAVATLTKSPGILLFISYFASIIVPHLKKIALANFSTFLKSLRLEKVFPLLLIPLSLLGVFILYKILLNDFFAYFHSGDNIHLVFPPFSIFNYSAPWVGTFWLEEVIFIYLIGAMGIFKLFSLGKKDAAIFVTVFFATILFVSHRDLLRYSLPIIPFLFGAFSETLIKKEFKYVIILLLLPIYLFSLAFITNSIMPIGDWGPFL